MPHEAHKTARVEQLKREAVWAYPVIDDKRVDAGKVQKSGVALAS